MLLVFGAPCQLPLLAGPEHGRTIPLAVKSRIEIPQCSSLLHTEVCSLSGNWQGYATVVVCEVLLEG
jgi:hypothetical protein